VAEIIEEGREIGTVRTNLAEIPNSTSPAPRTATPVGPYAGGRNLIIPRRRIALVTTPDRKLGISSDLWME
jgi:hypothetical protein